MKNMDVSIKDLTYEDALSFENWGKHKENYLADYNFLAKGEHEILSWYNWKQSQKNSKYLCILKDNEPVGFISVKEMAGKSAELGIVINPDMVGIGIGRIALPLAMEYGKEHHGITHYRLKVAAFNTRAIRMYTAVGFKIYQRTFETYKAGPLSDEEEELLEDCFFDFFFRKFCYIYKMRLEI